MLTLIASMDANRAIGRRGSLPWHLPQDLRDFRRETVGGALIMGRRTWDGLPEKPLRNRLSVVVSSAPLVPGALVARNALQALSLARADGYRRIYGIGGTRIFTDLMPFADRLLLTRLALEVEGADTWFPAIDRMGWKLVSSDRVTYDGVAVCIEERLRS